jgi:GGDEF domain-containing protein
MAAAAKRIQQIDYVKARRLLLVVGLGIIGLIVLYNFYRRVDTTEVMAVMLFAPVFVALIFWGVKGGAAAGVAAAIAYLGMRYPAMKAVDETWFFGTLLGRSLTFVVFGVVGGWASQQMASSLTKLELYDQIDDDTGLYNARYFGEELQVEIAKVNRYQATFSVTVLELPTNVLESIPARKRNNMMRALGRLIQRSVRPMDRVVHTTGPEGQIIAAILPETPVAGAQIFVDRLADGVAQNLACSRDELLVSALGYPEDEARLQVLADRVAAINRTERPAAPPATPQVQQG